MITTCTGLPGYKKSGRFSIFFNQLLNTVYYNYNLVHILVTFLTVVPIHDTCNLFYFQARKSYEGTCTQGLSLQGPFNPKVVAIVRERYGEEPKRKRDGRVISEKKIK